MLRPLGIFDVDEDVYDLYHKHVQRTLGLEDEFDERGVQNIEFDFADQSSLAWPKEFDHHLKAMPSMSLFAHNQYLSRRQANNKAPITPTGKHDLVRPDPQSASTRRRHPNAAYSSHISNQELLKHKSRLRGAASVTPLMNTAPQEGRDFAQFTGSMSFSTNDSRFEDRMLGILHDLPKQSGIPGFQRISFMRYPTESTGPRQMGLYMESDVPRSYVEDKCCCFEGVVLPGAHIILGRWWWPVHHNGRPIDAGPFILWEVDK